MAEKENKLRPFYKLGFCSIGQIEDQHYGNCVLCDDDEHFFVSENTTKCDCKKCGFDGNLQTFLTAYHERRLSETTDEDYEELSALRGIPVGALRKAKVAKAYDVWLIPAYGPNGEFVNDLRHWSPRLGLQACDGCKTQLWNASAMVHADEVWICEGEWDGMLMDWMFEQLGLAIRAVAVPGAHIFKDPWRSLFIGKRITYAYDHDEAGYSGTERGYLKTKSVGKQFRFVNWPSVYKNGYDLRDFYIAHSREPLKAIWASLKKLVLPTPARAFEGFSHAPLSGSDSVNGGKAAPGANVASQAVARNFDEVIEVFKKWMWLEKDMVLAMRIILATVLTEQLAGEPLWMYIVSPPGGGKTRLLSTLKDSPYVEFRSTVTPRTLVSGYQREPDPSLLSKVHKKILIFKDGTELFALPPPMQDEVFSIFRGAYDGSVERDYGNGVIRKYAPLHFTMLIGTTPVVDGNNRATVGERFMKFRLRYSDQTKAIVAAVNSVAKEQEQEVEMNKVVSEFLLDHMSAPGPPNVSHDILERIVALAQLVAMLRATVESDKYSGQLFYRPETEIGTRVGKQLTKLVMGLALVEKRTEVTFDDYLIAHRVALDTAIGFHTDIVRALAKGQERTLNELVDICKIPKTTLERNLEAMQALGVIQCRRTDIPGRPGMRPWLFSVTPKVLRLWENAETLSLPPLLPAPSSRLFLPAPPKLLLRKQNGIHR